MINTPQSCDAAMEVAVLGGGEVLCRQEQQVWLLSPPQGRFLKNRNQIYSCVYLEGQLGYFVYSKPTACDRMCQN